MQPVISSAADSEIRALMARLEAGPAPRMLVVGDLVADRYVYGRTERVSREAPVLVVRREREELRLGAAANAAWNAAVLGAHVSALGVLGDDRAGAEIQNLCAQSNITLGAVVAPGLRTETKTRILAGGLNTSRQQVLRLDEGHEGDLPAEVGRELAERVHALARACDVLVVSDYGAGVLGPEAIEAVRSVAARLPVVVDSRQQLSLFRGCTVAKPNEPELAAATGLPISTAKQLEHAAAKLRVALASSAVLVTRGREGMLLCGERSEWIPPHGVPNAVDVTGAGDAVIAVFATAIAMGASFSAAARLANIAGGIVVQKPGTAAASLGELRQALE